METHESRWKPFVSAYFPMFIATLSLLTSLYNGYLNNRFVDLIENNVARVEYMKTCKEIIDAYFQVKVKVATLSTLGTAGGAGSAGREQVAVAEAVARFGALGTYLANLRNEEIRERYTKLTWALEKVAADAGKTVPAALPKLLEQPDRDFGVLNDDCVKSAKSQRMSCLGCGAECRVTQAAFASYVQYFETEVATTSAYVGWPLISPTLRWNSVMPATNAGDTVAS